MSDKNTNKPEGKSQHSYRLASIAFFVAGLLLIVSESTRASGIPFLILGLTFFILGQDEAKKKPKK